MATRRWGWAAKLAARVARVVNPDHLDAAGCAPRVKGSVDVARLDRAACAGREDEVALVPVRSSLALRAAVCCVLRSRRAATQSAGSGSTSVEPSVFVRLLWMS